MIIRTILGCELDPQPQIPINNPVIPSPHLQFRSPIPHPQSSSPIPHLQSLSLIIIANPPSTVLNPNPSTPVLNRGDFTLPYFPGAITHHPLVSQNNIAATCSGTGGSTAEDMQTCALGEPLASPDVPRLEDVLF